MAERGIALTGLAVVDEDCSIGAETRVWQFASVIRGAVIDEDSSVGGCAIVDGARIGARARIGHGAQLHPGFVAGDDLFVGPGAIVCNDLWPWLGAQDFDLAALLSGERNAVVAEDRVTIGAGAIILPGSRLCEGSVVAAGAVLEGNLPAGHVIYRDGRIRPVRPAQAARMRYAA